MTKPQPQPQYLPALNRQLEHHAGLLPAVVPSEQLRPKSEPARPWLGNDFSHTVVTR